MIVFIFQINIFRKKSKHDLSGKRLKSEKLEWDRNQAKYSLKVKRLYSILMLIFSDFSF